MKTAEDGAVSYPPRVELGVAFPWKVASLGIAGLALTLGAAALRGPGSRLHRSGRPEACLACHAMEARHATWKASAHAKVAHCDDCHLPHGPQAERLAHQASDGLRHAAVTLLGAEPDAIRLGEAAAQTVQDNCLRCHGPGPRLPAAEGLPRPQAIPRDALHADPSRPCAGCHRETPHGRSSATAVKAA